MPSPPDPSPAVDAVVASGFDGAVVHVGTALPAEAVVVHVRRLVREGGRVHLAPAPDPTPSIFPAWSRAQVDLEAAEAWRAAAHAALEGAGFEVADDDAPEGSVAILDRNAPVDSVARHLEGGRAVALVRPETGTGGVGVLALADLRQARAALPVLARVVPGGDVHLLTLQQVPHGTAKDLREVLGWNGGLHLHAVGGGLTEAPAGVARLLDTLALDLLVTPTSTTWSLRPMLMLTTDWAADLLFVPGGPSLGELRLRWAAFASVPLARGTQIACVQVDPAGLVWMPPDGPCAVVEAGTVRATTTLTGGRAVVSPDVAAAPWGLASDPEVGPDSLQVVAHPVRRDGAPVALVPVDLDPGLVARAHGEGRRVWAVALQPCDPDAVRARLGVDAVLLAGSVLDDGAPRDVPAAAHAVVFDRVARALRAEGYPIALSVNPIGGSGFLHVRPEDLAALAPDALENAVRAASVPVTRGSLGDALRLRCGAVSTSAASLAWLSDSRAARQATLRLIDGATTRLRFQTFMWEDDTVGRAFADALARAGARGVDVQVLVDSLWSQHRSLARDNPVLSALDEAQGVQVRAWHPVQGVSDLKRRNHRKLVVADDDRALVHGRNVADHYFTSPDEVVLTPSTDQDGVPWVDLSTEVTGPVVACVAAAFDGAWVEAEGTPGPAVAAGPRTGVPLWWIAHTSLRDTHTLDALRELFARARHRIRIVNTFALQHELQHALVDALRRGVAVEVVTGHVRPRHQGGQVPFPGSPGRDFATEIIHGRWDVLAGAGATVVACAQPARPHWHADVGAILPHVHAKAVTIDGQLAAVGSFNVDISSAYWESEVMMVVADPERVGALDGWIGGMLDLGVRFDPHDPTWQHHAAQRSWISEHWPAIIS
ncbi:MAG: phosphatidylserine/phosphatidylglycerophosphate/cardiolipin synthase family protein [Alphaproteobacteria bacterium]|nr:phosphatidylserine/phosphatidylglycerophosphate/cardiolipin synthase family protein [Alphaproteobacteria bacterium]